MMLFVCSNCRDGDFFEEAELETSRDVEPHGEVTHWKECPKCLSRDHLIELKGEGLDVLRSYARSNGTVSTRLWAIEVLYDLAAGQVAA